MAKKSILKERGTNESLYPVTQLECIDDFPKDGDVGKILTHNGNHPIWEDFSQIMLDTYSYGVEWQPDVADPVLMRVGNMTYHKTLPIQSGMKGCVYRPKEKKVAYWLNENDWRLRKDFTSIPFSDSSTPDIWPDRSQSAIWFDVSKVSDNIIKRCSAYGTYALWYVAGSNYVNLIRFTGETVIGTSVPNVMAFYETVAHMDNYDTTTILPHLEIHSNLAGYDGEVMVYVPEFWIKSLVETNKRGVRIATKEIDNTWEHQPALFVGAYKNVILHDVPENMGYLSTLTNDSAVSIANPSTYCRGGRNRADYDKYFTGANSTTVDVFKSDLGKPSCIRIRDNARMACKKAGTNMLSYDQYKNIFYWLYVIEYANFNSLAGFIGFPTEEGFSQGGLDTGITNVTNWNTYNEAEPVCPNGFTNEFGNGTTAKKQIGGNNLDKTLRGAGPEPINNIYPIRWRGIENPFGDTPMHLDGILIDGDVDNHSDLKYYVYTCKDPSKFADTLNDGYEKVAEGDAYEGYIKVFDLGNNAHIIPDTIDTSSTDSTSHKCDFQYFGGTVLGEPIVGGWADWGGLAGLCAFDISYEASDPGVEEDYSLLTFRSVFCPTN